MGAEEAWNSEGDDATPGGKPRDHVLGGEPSATPSQRPFHCELLSDSEFSPRPSLSPQLRVPSLGCTIVEHAHDRRQVITRAQVLRYSRHVLVPITLLEQSKTT